MHCRKPAGYFGFFKINFKLGEGEGSRLYYSLPQKLQCMETSFLVRKEVKICGTKQITEKYTAHKNV